jgi:hypothetical protein
MLGGTSSGVNAEAIAGGPRHRRRRPIRPIARNVARSGTVDDIHNSPAARLQMVFPYTRRLAGLSATLDFPVLLLNSLPVEMTYKL